MYVSARNSNKFMRVRHEEKLRRKREKLIITGVLHNSMGYKNVW